MLKMFLHMLWSQKSLISFFFFLIGKSQYMFPNHSPTAYYQLLFPLSRFRRCLWHSNSMWHKENGIKRNFCLSLSSEYHATNVTVRTQRYSKSLIGRASEEMRTYKESWGSVWREAWGWVRRRERPSVWLEKNRFGEIDLES